MATKAGFVKAVSEIPQKGCCGKKQGFFYKADVNRFFTGRKDKRFYFANYRIQEFTLSRFSSSFSI
ncbi:MAG: hypothetical protein WDO71_07285 [Bacteroidota bacterium]